MKSKDIQELTIEEINKKLRETRLELVNLRVRKQAGQVENPMQLNVLRKDIARLETILNQKKKAVAA